ncbi:seipin isoform X2 [Biomphalaria pfeifferi]|uniref:Seipin n=1 Tax=Biomphalaria pfeifferi TaxID=112525 RepID=A0AAD8BPP8_BIOPF|nr:seipin isoform X2 [Biomphalaria pfeifferi]
MNKTSRFGIRMRTKSLKPEIKRPVHLTYNVCSSGVGVCSFPSANVTFWNDEGTIQEVLTVGQAYMVDVELELPDSSANRNLGMFQVSVKMYDRTGQVSLTTQRTAMVRYRSIVLRMLDLLLWIPFYFVGISEQKHSIMINMFTHYVDDYYHPSVGATVEVQSHKIEIYTATITFSAKFSGLKYLLYHWPVLSGLCAFSVNVLILALGLAVAAYQRTETLQKITAAVQITEKAEVTVKNDQKTFASSSTMTEDKNISQTSKIEINAEDDTLPLIQEPLDFDFAVENTDTEVVNELRQRSIQH